MAYRRRQGMGRSSTFMEDNNNYNRSPEEGGGGAMHSTSSSLAAQAIMASAAHRDSSAYARKGGEGDSFYDYSSMEGSNEAAGGSFWGVVARKAKAILVDQDEGLAMAENKTADVIKETQKMLIRRKEGAGLASPNHTSQEDMLKASRDVAMATAAKVKLLLREIRTVKADLAFATQRCSQLEEENKILRDSREKGTNLIPPDDDMIRLQLETLLTEKARLGHENSMYARENRFLREIVEYHQLTMQDVIYLDEGIHDEAENYTGSILSNSPPSPPSPLSRASSMRAKEIMINDN